VDPETQGPGKSGDLWGPNFLYQTVRFYCLSRDCPKTDACRLKCLTHLLTTVASLEPKRKGAQPPFYITTTYSPVRCAFWGSGGASAPRWFLLSSIILHAVKPYQCVNFSNEHFLWAVSEESSTFPSCAGGGTKFFEQCISTSILKCLRYSRGIGQVQIRVQNETVTKSLPSLSFGEVFLQRHFDSN